MAVILFTDFGAAGPYLGQMEMVIEQLAPSCRVINLLSNAPRAEPVLSGYLLAALSKQFPAQTIFLAVVDPGVGGERAAVVLEADGRLFVGPDNGLLNSVAVQASQVQWSDITWRPAHCSSSFHGRDIFAPIAARLVNQQAGGCLRPFERSLADWPADLAQIVYFDDYGNAMTGIRFRSDWQDRTLSVNGCRIEPAETFCRVAKGELFWYRNSCGLIEIAANQDSAELCLNLRLGDSVEPCPV